MHVYMDECKQVSLWLHWASVGMGVLGDILKFPAGCSAYTDGTLGELMKMKTKLFKELMLRTRPDTVSSSPLPPCVGAAAGLSFSGTGS